MPLRSALVGGIVASVVLILASSSLIVEVFNRLTILAEGALVPSLPLELPSSSRTPRISGDMSATFRGLEQMPVGGPKQPLPPMRPIGQIGKERLSPAADADPSIGAALPFASMPGAVPAALAGADSPTLLDADRPIGGIPGKAMPTSLLPHRVQIGDGPTRSGRVLDARHTAAFNSLMTQPRPTGPAAVAPAGASPQLDQSGKDEASMTADELNEREHQRHKRSGANGTPQ